MDLFESGQSMENRPLADRLRPKRLEDFVGQSKWREFLERQRKSGRLPSMILWGPPGSGKTSFALLVVEYFQGQFINENAIDLGAKRIREIGKDAKARKLQYGETTFLFVDEIHRLNKGQQDVLLPFVERGDFILIGATTENPSYELNSALLSRCHLLVFERLSPEQLRQILKRAEEVQHLPVDQVLDPEALDQLISAADGDARRLLNGWEALHQTYQTAQENASSESSSEFPTKLNLEFPLKPEAMWALLGETLLRYDRDRDEHYDTVSAFIKSVRGSDPDASIYYLARMIAGGEDPVFIARRLVILASEDIGNADPRGLSVAVAGLQAVELVGWPEAAICLAQVTTYLASAPKSNRSYIALKKAQEVVEKSGSLPVPLHLRPGKNAFMRQLGYSRGYKYSHEGPTGWLPQDYLPEVLKGKKFYEPVGRGFEKNIRQYLEWMKGEAVRSEKDDREGV